jgi:hypothetical protein
LQQASSAVKNKLQETLHVLLNVDDCGGSKNLKLIHFVEEYVWLIQNVKTLARSDSSRKSYVNFTAIPQLVNT